MNISYDYLEIYQELIEELELNELTEDSVIQVLRSKEKIAENYYPIIDWYYDDDTQISSLLPDPLDYMFPEDQILYGDEIEKEEKELTELRHSYYKDKPHLISMTVHDVIEEMQLWDFSIRAS
jgi:hypothetical protein